MTTLRLTFLLVLGALACQADSEYEDGGRLYRSIDVGDYDNAVAISKRYQYNGKVIKDVVEKLVNDTQRNVIDYAYALWNNGCQDIVRNYFPIAIRSVIAQHAVKIIGNRDNMVLKLDVNLDGDGDRRAFGDSNHMIGDRMAWKFIPVQIDNKLYFQIYNAHTNFYLKFGATQDSDGDYKVYGGVRSGSYKHQFYLVPARYEEKVLFFIINREYQQGLKLSRAVDSDGDRSVYGENGKVLGDPYSFGWLIQPY